jgi:hypothetical protein
MTTPAYVAPQRWDTTRPSVLVIACSDGRLQEPMDEFLASRGVTHYDRLYLPGGPGALASSGVSFVRADQARRECTFLVEAHGIEEVYLVFHGPSEDGPEEATCGDYRRKLPTNSAEQIRTQQLHDARELLRNGFGWNVDPLIHTFRCEITAGGGVAFVALEAQVSSPVTAHPLAL